MNKVGTVVQAHTYFDFKAQASVVDIIWTKTRLCQSQDITEMLKGFVSFFKESLDIRKANWNQIFFSLSLLQLRVKSHITGYCCSSLDRGKQVQERTWEKQWHLYEWKLILLVQNKIGTFFTPCLLQEVKACAMHMKYGIKSTLLKSHAQH